MLLSNILIQVSMKLIVKQREIIGIKFESSVRGQPPKKYVAPIDFSLRL